MGTYRGVGSWYRGFEDRLALVFDVRGFIWVSSNVVVRFILILNIRVDPHLFLHHYMLLLPSTLGRLSAIEIIVFFLDHLLSHLSYRRSHLLLLRVSSLTRCDQPSCTLQARVDVVFLLVRRELMDSFWDGV